MDPYSALNVYNEINQKATDRKKLICCNITRHMWQNNSDVAESQVSLSQGDKAFYSSQYPDYIHAEHTLTVRLVSEKGIDGIFLLLLLLLMAAETRPE